jgi:hypothetical protein
MFMYPLPSRHALGTREQTLDRKVDMDSFLWPLIEDLRTMATTGVPAKRWTANKLVNFTMRAHLVVISGDMPAIAKVSRIARELTQ